MAADSTSAVRAIFVTDHLAMLADCGRRDEVVAALAPAARAAIAELRPTGWVDIRHMIALYDGTFAVMGDDAAFAVCHDTMVRTLRDGAFRDVLESARRLKGRTPASVLKYAPSVWAQSTRGAGVQRLTVDEEGRADIEWTAVPAAMARSSGYVEAMRAKYRAHLTVFDLAGRVEVTRRDPLAGVLVFSLVW